MAALVGAGLLGALLVGEIANQVVGSGTAASVRVRRSYFSAVQPILVDSASVGDLVRSVRDNTAATSGRLALDGVLSRARSDARASVDLLATVGIGAPSPQLAAALASVLSLRWRAVTELADGVVEAIGSPGRPPDLGRAAALLTAAGSLALDADSTYVHFEKAVHKLDRSAPVLASRWIAVPRLWQLRAATRWARSLAADPSLRAVQAVRIVSLSLEPAAVRILGLPTTTTTSTTTTSTTTTTVPTTTSTLAKGGNTKRPATSGTTTSTVPPPPTTLQLPPARSVSVLPPTGTLAVVAVVADSGNVAVPGIVVSATITGSSPGPTRAASPVVVAATRTRRLGTIVAGGARYLSLPSARVHLGGAYEIVVTVTAPGVPSAVARVHVRVAAA